MPNQTNQIFYQALYKSNTLLVKHATYQKVESLRAVSLSKLKNILTTTLSLIQNVLHSLPNGCCCFIFVTLLVHTTTPTIST